MFDYRKFLDEELNDAKLEVWQSKKDSHIEIFGNEKGLLYLAARIIEFIEDDFAQYPKAELNLDAGVDLGSGSSSICIFVKNNE